MISPEPAEERRDWLNWIAAKFAGLRFVTTSLLLHVMIVVVVGTAVISKVEVQTPDFTASPAGLVAESTEAKPPPETPQTADSQSFTPPSPTAAAPPVSAILSASTRPASFVMAAPQAQAHGSSDAMAAAAEKALRGAADGMAGKIGGTGMIFGKKVEAKTLGVILDVSGSAHPYLASAIEEIQKSFANAVILLYPGCGMVDVPGRRLHDVRPMTSIMDSELGPGAPSRSTPEQLGKAMQIPAFNQLLHTQTVREKVWVSWYADREGKGENLVTQTHEAFYDLIKRGVDTIYWFSDFKDRVEPKAHDALLRQLKAKKVKVYAHNFADAIFPIEVTNIVDQTGGTKDSVKPAN